MIKNFKNTIITICTVCAVVLTTMFVIAGIDIIKANKRKDEYKLFVKG